MSIDSTAQAYTTLGNKLMDAAIGTASFGPIVRQPIPSDPDTLTLLHWLFAAKGDIPIPRVVLDLPVTAADTSLVIPAAHGGRFTQRVFQVYPFGASLLYPSPYSPVLGGDAIEITEDDWKIEGSRTIITHPDITPGAWRIVYAHGGTEEVVKRGDGYEAWPIWTRIPPGYAACAPDTFRWFDMAATEAIELDKREGRADRWTRLRAAVRRTAVRGQDITDLRDVFKPLPGMDAFDLDGMFARSDHPLAEPPPTPLDQNWLGYNFWDRDEATGDLIGIVPGYPAGQSGTATVQIGRGVADAWRVATNFQDPDQYLYVELAVRKDEAASFPEGSAVVFASSTRDYRPTSRWQALIPFGQGVLVEIVDGYEIRGYLLQRIDMRLVANDTPMPEGQTLVNFGVELRFSGRYRVRLRQMRLLSGPSSTWVLNNLEQAKRGSPMPYFPGATPFALNADTITGNFVGYNGNPFHGYQLPDLWLDLEAESELIYPGLTPARLPLPDNTGGIAYPLLSTNPNGSTKPPAILLAEQQVMFLRDAQLRYLADRGVDGPFAHTFVLNTAARHNIGSPNPHTWVYTGDDPNTPWVGYQVRPVEALARLVYKTTGRENAQALRTLASTVANKWLDWLAAAWPNLDGFPFRGMPTEFPGDRAPATTQEEPHAVAIVLRALLWLRMGGDTDATRAALAKRCWDYLESMWVTEGRMAFTWSPVPQQRQWYGFWHGEIMDTLALIVLEARDHLPEGVVRDVAIDRLAKSYTWLTQWGIREVR